MWRFNRSHQRDEFEVWSGCLREDGPSLSGMLVSEGDGDFVPGFVVSESVRPPALVVGPPMHMHEFGSCTVDEQRSQVGISSFGDASEGISTTGGSLPGYESEPGTELSPVFEITTIADGCD